MKLRVPDYYDNFECIGSACADSCCAGWEIDVDDEAYRKYSSVKGLFGARLMSSISPSRPYHFIMDEGRCPFLNEKNLCDIYIHMGEESLCQICADHPRFYESYGNREEAGLGLVCEEAARLILTNKKKAGFIDKILDEGTEEEGPRSHMLFLARDHMMLHLQERKQSLGKRLAQVLTEASILQEDVNRQDMKSMNLHIHKKWETKDGVQEPSSDLQGWFTGCFDFLRDLEILTPEWKQILTLASEKARKGSICFSVLDEIFYEQLMIYFVYRYFLRSVYDFQLLDKIRFAVFSCLAVRGLEAAVSGEEKFPSLEIARLYSKEIEYSEENMEAVNEEILFSDMFETRTLSDTASAVFGNLCFSNKTEVIYE